LVETVDETLLCLVDVLGLLNTEPALPGRVVGFGWIATRVDPPLRVTLDLSTILSFRPFCSPSMLPDPVGEGNWVNLKSDEADSRLLCRSSKLTEGRKSKEPVVESPTSLGPPFLAPKEKRLWLLEVVALSIETSAVGRRKEPIFVGLAFSLLLFAMKESSC
jgi:hypothetical protein